MFSGDEERERDKVLGGSGRGTDGGQSNPILAHGWPDICRQLQILMEWCLFIGARHSKVVYKSTLLSSNSGEAVVGAGYAAAIQGVVIRGSSQP